VASGVGVRLDVLETSGDSSELVAGLRPDNSSELVAGLRPDNWRVLGTGLTDADGRVSGLLAAGKLEARTYRLSFETGAYYRAQGRPGFYPRVDIIFEVVETTDHYHVPLLLSPFGYSTYRGS
jgi:5-hydroxyisourate hydrolase